MSTRSNMAGKPPLIIFDTTLCDGAMAPGVSLHPDEAVDIAKHLSRLGVHVCEAGFPALSDHAYHTVELIAKHVGPLMHNRERLARPMVICARARALESDIQRAYDAIRHAPYHRIHIYLGTSRSYLEQKLHMSEAECIDRAITAVRFAKTLCSDIEFSPEDSGRSDPAFLCQVLAAVIREGATTLNIPDTAGFNTPEEYGRIMRYLIQHTPGAEQVTWSCHCHNDLGLATANTLSGIMNGARQVEVTINGLGERAGNTALEEVALAVFTHPKTFPVSCAALDTQHLHRVSQLVASKTGVPVPVTKPIVGANALVRSDDEVGPAIISPAVIGMPVASDPNDAAVGTYVLSRTAGVQAFCARVAHLGYDLADHDLQRMYARFVRTADTKQVVTDADIVAMVDDELSHARGGAGCGATALELRSVHVTSGTGILATATVELVVTDPPPLNRERIAVDAAISRNGPIHAIFKAVERLVRVRVTLLQYEVRAVSAGGDGDALGQVAVKICDGARPHIQYCGTATDTDVVMASARAYVAAVNRMILHGQHSAAGATSVPPAPVPLAVDEDEDDEDNDDDLEAMRQLAAAGASGTCGPVHSAGPASALAPVPGSLNAAVQDPAGAPARAPHAATGGSAAPGRAAAC
ncbi:hypothetical protein AMAG_14594 [Allomyces macrogynus ATCC 38327]|uniref:2-isopropylmalate synthase n=1 Tax=Allomyces macrogynus (strain ATCC 38327) TaxID=578462 RepID=A0A0L0T6T2_ALLM3|nr:hypothetical protein AMAG_14594 [Allomyces macrogynus ATCC 38327]|eukprot:KNE70468.1 hypothetical protein AMAG_14594 [Allomyces macrogynus ATCC 38327]